mmetsp:Transcript_26931/g.43590  ORF Transcript_26931/g.43590 Transcript_26931/m.43590 type:complete len:230 (-) Transcript_26931:286-975(-)
MRMGSLQITATLQPPMLCLDECVAADSLEVEIGDLCMAPAPPAPPAPSPGIGDHAVKLKLLKAHKTSNSSRVSWGCTTFHSAEAKWDSGADSDDSIGQRSTSSGSDSGSDDLMRRQPVRLVAQRIERRKRRETRVQKFLHTNGFADVNDVSKCPEKLSPIHIAAKCGDHGMIRLLLTANADPAAKTAVGRTALDFARELPNCETKLHVVELLHSREKTVAMRDFHKMAA